jgi:hypothetical protein
MPDCLASGHSGTGMKRSAYAGTSPVPNYAKRQPVKATGGIQLSSDPQNFEEVNTLSVENEDVHSMYEQFVQSLKKVPLPFIEAENRIGILCSQPAT